MARRATEHITAQRHEPALALRRLFGFLKDLLVEGEALIGFVWRHRLSRTIPGCQRFPIRPYVEHLKPRWPGDRPDQLLGVGLGSGEGSIFGVAQAFQEHSGAGVRRPRALDERVAFLREEPVLCEIVKDEPDHEASRRRDTNERRKHACPEGERRSAVLLTPLSHLMPLQALLEEAFAGSRAAR